MSHSPCRTHFLRASAAALGIPDQPRNAASANQYELMLMKLAEDRRRLKAIQSIEQKIDVKRQLLPEYTPWIEGVLDTQSGQQDDVLMSVFVWAIDTSDFATALRIATYAIEHKLVMPDQYKRDVACVLAEEIADQSLKAIEAGQPAALYCIAAAIGLTDGQDMPDEVRAKLYKAHGYALRQANELELARASLTRALELHAKVGVKKDIERIDTLIKNSAPAAVNAETPANPDPNG